MTQSLALLASQFMPSASLTGGENLTIFRGKNCFIRGMRGAWKIKNYEGSKNLTENYDISAEELTGRLDWLADDPKIQANGGTGTLFTTELHIGQLILSEAEVFSVRRIESDLIFYADRAPTTNATNVKGRYLPVLFEIDKTRGVLRRGNAIKREQGDIILVGSGLFYRNAVSTTFSAKSTPKRLEYNTNGTYTEFALGFTSAPPVPVISNVNTGGTKRMSGTATAGKYSFMISYWNSKTRGFSNPTPVIKTDVSGFELIIIHDAPPPNVARFGFDFTSSLVGMPTNADGFIIWQSLSGGGVAAVNATNQANGPWFLAAKVKTTARNVTNSNNAADTITIPEHLFYTGGEMYFTGASLPGGISAATLYFAIVVDRNTVKAATTYANAIAGTALAITSDGGTGTVSPLTAADLYYHEALDAELGMIASGDNDAPPQCEFVADFANTTFYLSALGKKTTTTGDGTNPGNYALMAKPSNKESAPYGWAVSVGEEILGFATGVGRMFCLTEKGIPFITATGRTEIARLIPTLLDFPFTSRPFWTKGGINPYSITTIQGDIYLYSGRRLLMSPRGADEYANPFDMGKVIQDLTENIPSGHVFLCHDPKNQQLCVIASATRIVNGYWISEIFPFDLETNTWQPVIEIAVTDRDMIVSGVAIVNDRMEFLAGGRVAGGTFSVSTYRYDEPGSGAVPYYFLIQPTDNGEEQRNKRIKSVRVTGRVTSPVVQIHGANRGDTIDVGDMEAGTDSASGNIALTTSGVIKRQYKAQFEVKNLAIWALRFSGTWDGSDDVDEIEEIVVELDTHGGKK